MERFSAAENRYFVLLHTLKTMTGITPVLRWLDPALRLAPVLSSAHPSQLSARLLSRPEFRLLGDQAPARVSRRWNRTLHLLSSSVSGLPRSDLCRGRQFRNPVLLPLNCHLSAATWMEV